MFLNLEMLARDELPKVLLKLEKLDRKLGFECCRTINQYTNRGNNPKGFH